MSRVSPFVELERALEVARRAVESAAVASLRFWRTDVDVLHKSDASPVTAADHAAEAAILSLIREAFPDHGILAEESGAALTGSPSRWIVDPLDGTRGFARGGSFWGPLVALEHEGEMLVGAMALPALGETYWAARGLGAWRDGERLAVSSIGRWSEATLSVGEFGRLLAGSRCEGVTELVRTAASTRGYGDVAGCALLLNGRAEAWLESGVKLWDLAACQVLVEEAGGRFTDFDGSGSLASGNAAASNGLLHERVLEGLRVKAGSIAGGR